MTTPQFAQECGQHLRQSHRRDGRRFLLPLGVLAALAFGAFAYIGYVLWPVRPGPLVDAPPPTAGHGRGCGIPAAASCNPRSGTAPPGRTGPRRLGLSVAFAQATECYREGALSAAERGVR